MSARTSRHILCSSEEFAMRPFRPLSWLLLLLVSAAPAAAQRSPVFLLHGGAGSIGSLPIGASFDRYSEQFERAVLAGSGSVKLANLAWADLGTTYGVRFRGWDQRIASERYRAAAFLATQIPSARPNEARRLYLAMWGLMGETDLGAAVAFRGADPRIGVLMQDALLGADVVDATQWTIASDVNVAGSSTNEMLVQSLAAEHTEHSVVPEPEVVILLATGLLALGAVAYFRGMV
jgi:hypothetical protein